LFWDKTGGREGADSLERFASALASHLATFFSREYETALVNRLHQSPRNVRMLSIREQLVSLVIQPMSQLSEVFLSAAIHPVIVLDGLDECGDRDILAQLIESVLLGGLPRNFTILFTARPEPEIRDAWGNSLDILYVCMILIKEWRGTDWQVHHEATTTTGTFSTQLL